MDRQRNTIGSIDNTIEGIANEGIVLDNYVELSY